MPVTVAVGEPVVDADVDVLDPVEPVTSGDAASVDRGIVTPFGFVTASQ